MDNNVEAGALRHVLSGGIVLIDLQKSPVKYSLSHTSCSLDFIRRYNGLSGFSPGIVPSSHRSPLS